MGWRVSWYRADNENPIKTKFIENEGYEVAEINGELVLSDQGTDIWKELLYNNDDFKKEVKCLYDDPDCDYYSITKEGFKMIILAYRERVINNIKKQIDVYNNPELKDTPDYWRCDGNLLRLIMEELHIWEFTFPREDGSICYENIDINKPKGEFGISGSWTYKYAIFDMIEVYKYFDWDNYTMVVYGG